MNAGKNAKAPAISLLNIRKLKADLVKETEKEIDTNPWTTSRDLIRVLSQTNPMFNRFFFPERVGMEISPVGKRLLMKARTPKAVLGIMKKHTRTSDWFRVRPSFMMDVRKAVESGSEPRLLYGLHKGYAFSPDVKVDDHAKWTHFRMTRVGGEAPKFKLSVREMMNSKRHTKEANHINTYTLNMQDQRGAFAVRGFIAKFL